MSDVLNRWDLRDYLIAALAFTLVFFIALALQQQYSVLSGPDAVAYVTGAESLVQGKGYTDLLTGTPLLHPAPMTSIIIAGAFRLLGQSFAAATAAMAFLAGLAVAASYLLARLFQPRAVAALAAALVATTPMFFESALFINSDVLGTLLMTAVLTGLIIATHEKSIPAAAAAGVFLGLAVLSRTVFPPLAAVAATYLLIRTRNWKLALVLIAAVALVASPWLVRNAALTGNPVHNPSVIGNLPVVATSSALNEGYERIAFEYSQGTAEARFDLFALIKKVVIHLPLIAGYYLPSMAGGMLLLLFVLLELALNGAFVLRYQDWFLVAVAYFIAGLAATYPLARYFLPVLPVIAILAAAGFVRMLGKARAHLSPAVRPLVTVIAVALLLMAGLSQLAPRLAGADSWKANEAREYVAVGAWLREHTPADATLLARDSRISYYAGRKFDLIPPLPLPEVIAFAKAKNITHIVYDERAGHDRRPQLRMLATPGPHEGLNLTHTELGGKLDVYVWEVLP